MYIVYTILNRILFNNIIEHVRILVRNAHKGSLAKQIKLKSDASNVPKQADTKRDGVRNLQFQSIYNMENLENLKTQRINQNVKSYIIP